MASRGMELQLRRMLVGMVGKSAMLAGIFSTHFAILDTLPLTLTASLWYMASATAAVFLILVLGNMSSVFLRHCFCCNSCCRAAAAGNTKALALVDTSPAIDNVTVGWRKSRAYLSHGLKGVRVYRMVKGVN